MLDRTPKSGLYILTRPDDRPWFTAKNDKEMGKAFRDHMRTAKLYPDDPKERLHFNGLRGTAVTPLAEVDAQRRKLFRSPDTRCNPQPEFSKSISRGLRRFPVPRSSSSRTPRQPILQASCKLRMARKN
jgi:hypothetical protein